MRRARRPKLLVLLVLLVLLGIVALVGTAALALRARRRTTRAAPASARPRPVDGLASLVVSDDAAPDTAPDSESGSAPTDDEPVVTARRYHASDTSDPIVTDEVKPDERPDERDEPAAVAEPDVTVPNVVEPAAPEIDLDRIERDLAGVEAALRRLDDGSYWTDEVTGLTLDDALLAADPVARLNVA
jgi:RNA polymerase-binding transcription factor DksA